MPVYVALLRGINVGGRNKLPMSELCALCVELGWSNVNSYIQSGNLVFEANADCAILETELELAIQQRFGLDIHIVVRSAAQWQAYLGSNPYLALSEQDLAHVMLALSKVSPLPGAVEKLRERAADGETITQVHDAIWIHFANGVANSKLSPVLLDRLVGSPVTTRNWRTVTKLNELVLRHIGNK